MTSKLAPLVLLLLALPALAEDVRPDGTQNEAGTDCTTSDAHTKTDNDTDDSWDTNDDCADDSCTAAADTTFVSQITFATPSANPTVVTDDQVMAVRARKCNDGQGGTPEIRIDSYCAGTLVDTGTSTAIAWNAGEGTVVTEAWTFNTTDCTSDGSDVEVLIFCDAAGGAPGNRVGCDFDAVEWRATVGAAAEEMMIIGK
jgi:hypothetical protein